MSFFPGTGTVGQRRGEAEQDFGGGGGIGEGAVGLEGPGAEVAADGGEIVASEMEKAAGDVEGVVPRTGGKCDAEAVGVGVDHREIERDIVADEHGFLNEAGELARDVRRVAAMSPGFRHQRLRIPAGMPAWRAAIVVHRAGIPAGMQTLFVIFRWCRCAQPPANRCEASGFGIA
jgi:hypothetical protein